MDWSYCRQASALKGRKDEVCRMCGEDSAPQWRCCIGSGKIKPCQCCCVHEYCLMKEIQELQTSSSPLIQPSRHPRGLIYTCHHCNTPILFSTRFSSHLICETQPCLVIWFFLLLAIPLVLGLVLLFMAWSNNPEQALLPSICLACIAIVLMLAFLFCVPTYRFRTTSRRQKPPTEKNILSNHDIEADNT